MIDLRPDAMTTAPVVSTIEDRYCVFASAHSFSDVQHAAMVPPIRVLVVDDAAFFREVVISCLSDEPDIEVAGEAADGESAVTQARRLRPDVVLMDINMPGISGVEATRRIRAEWPDIAIIGLSMHGDSDMARPMHDAGARKYLSKSGDTESLLRAIRDCR